MSSNVCDINVAGNSRISATASSDQDAHTHSHDQPHDHHHGHDHAAEHGHSHPQMDHPGKFHERDLPDYSKRDWDERAFSVGIGGPVGSGKTALLLALCRRLTGLKLSACATTNDIFTSEDHDFLVKNAALDPPTRIRAVETGGCPHAAIREDISANLMTMEELQAEFNPHIQLVESGGDNLAASYSMELVDFEIYVIDVAGGDKVPRKGGPGISQSSLLVINKTDLAPHVGASLEVMDRDARMMRDGGPFVFTSVRNDEGVDDVVKHILEAWKASGAEKAWRSKS